MDGAHRLRAKRVELVQGESRRIGQGLANVRFLEVRQIGHDLSRRHAAGDEIDDVRHGNPKSANSRAARQHVWLVGDPVEGSRHTPIIDLYALTILAVLAGTNLAKPR